MFKRTKVLTAILDQLVIMNKLLAQQVNVEVEKGKIMGAQYRMAHEAMTAPQQDPLVLVDQLIAKMRGQAPEKKVD